MAKTTRPLTNTEVAKSKPKDKLYRLYDGGGLVLNIATSGTKTWYYQYKRPHDKTSDMYKIGRYPALSLADARKKRAEFEALIERGIDPKRQAQSDADAERQRLEGDFKSVFNEWLPTKNYSTGTIAKMQNYIDEILSVIGNKPVADITTADCLSVLRPVEQAGHFTKLQKMRTMINQVMAYAIATGRTDTNPAIHLRGVFKSAETRHNPAILDESRLAELVQCINSYSGHFTTRKALYFALLVFARPGEVRHLKWDDVDLDKGLWTYTPSKTTKSTKVKMVTPLSAQAVEILRQVREHRQSDFAFPSVTSNVRPMSENTLNQAIRRMGFDSGEQTSQGFRAIARTLLEERFKFDYRYIEMQLGHQIRDPNGRAYNRVQWIDERREMMQKWADYLDSLKVDAQM